MVSMLRSSTKHLRILKQPFVLISALFLLVSTACLVAMGVASESDTSVSRAARRYRMQVFQSYHANRAEYDRRIEAGNRVLEVWSTRGKPETEQSQLLDWFRQATDASQVGLERPLPLFDPTDEVTQRPQLETPQPSPDITSEPTKPEPPRNSTPQEILQSPDTESKPDRRRQETGPIVSPQPPTLDPQSGTEPTIARDVPVPSRPRNIPPTVRLQASQPKSNQNEIIQITPREAAPQATPPQQRLQRSRRTTSTFPEPDATLARQANAERLKVPGPAKLDEKADIGPIPQLETERAVKLGVETPRVASALSKPFPPASIDLQAAISRMESAVASRTGQIDLAVLAARIRASNLRLAEIDSELSENGLWDARRLRPLVDRFDRMLSGRRLSELYFEALSQSERQRVTTLKPMQPTINLLAQRLFEARVAVAEDPVFEPTDSLEAEQLQKMINVIDTWK